MEYGDFSDLLSLPSSYNAFFNEIRMNNPQNVYWNVFSLVLFFHEISCVRHYDDFDFINDTRSCS